MTEHTTQDPDGNVALDALARQVRADLHTLRYPHDPWVIAHQQESGRHVYDVVIIGAGQSGLAVAAGLLRERVENIIAFDRRAAGEDADKFAANFCSYAEAEMLGTVPFSNPPAGSQKDS